MTKLAELADEIERLAKAATPGPFIVSTCASPEESKGEVTLDALRSGGMGEVVYRYKWIKNRADCDLDAFCRNNLPAILSALREGERLRGALETIKNTFSRDIEQGYVTKDKQCAIDIARAALSAKEPGHDA